MLDILGVADAELVFDAAEALADHDPGAALLTVKRLSDSGRDLTQFMRDLTAHLRHLFVVQTLGEVPDSFSVTAEQTDRLAAQADALPQGESLRAIDFLAAAIAAVKEGSEPRIQLEVALLKATQPQRRPLDPGAHEPDRAARGGARGGRAGAGPRRRAAAEPAPEPSRPRRRLTRRAPPGRHRVRAAGGGGRGREAAATRDGVELDQVLALWPAVLRRWPRRTGCSAPRCAAPGPPRSRASG